jgi:hypothetical protein
MTPLPHRYEVRISGGPLGRATLATSGVPDLARGFRRPGRRLESRTAPGCRRRGLFPAHIPGDRPGLTDRVHIAGSRR